jgi:hypothetical protein
MGRLGGLIVLPIEHWSLTIVYTASRQRPKMPEKPRLPYTGEKTGTRKRKAIIEARAQGHGLLKVASDVGSSHHLVKVVAEQEADKIAQRKREITANMWDYALAGTKRLLENVENMELGSLPIATAIAIDKALLLSGEATSHVEVVHKLDVGSLATRLASIPKVTIDSSPSIGNVIDVQPLAPLEP